jgi:hypothetical protein
MPDHTLPLYLTHRRVERLSSDATLDVAVTVAGVSGASTAGPIRMSGTMHFVLERVGS